MRFGIVVAALALSCGKSEQAPNTSKGTVMIEWDVADDDRYWKDAVLVEEDPIRHEEVSILAWDPPAKYQLAIETGVIEVNDRRYLAPLGIAAKLSVELPFKAEPGDCGALQEAPDQPVLLQVVCTFPRGGGFVVTGGGAAYEMTPRDDQGEQE